MDKLPNKENISEVIAELSKSPMDNINRVEVFDENRRVYINWKPNNKVELQFQDEGQTLKIFISQKKQ